MAVVAEVFGEVAGDYDDARPGYPPAVAEAILAYHGRVPPRLVEVGAGTGLATGLLARLGAPVTCVEPDRRMAAVLAARHPAVEVVVAPFEEWTPPPGGVPLLACAMAWHWLDPTTRCRGRTTRSPRAAPWPSSPTATTTSTRPGRRRCGRRSSRWTRTSSTTARRVGSARRSPPVGSSSRSAPSGSAVRCP
ncbi:methyltransferase domain-containing protein [Micromonospora sp. CPCC 205739]|uniref:methyltransferase domain-containing protein n=1 Tax=unclassified Micromonospora TaxID=2617518 RepID=UPI003FA5B8F5